MVGSLLDSKSPSFFSFFFFYFTLEWSSFHKEAKYGKWTSKYNFIHVADQCGSSFLLWLHYSLWTVLRTQLTYLCNCLSFIQQLLIEDSKTAKTVKFALWTKPPSHSPDFFSLLLFLSHFSLGFPHRKGLYPFPSSPSLQPPLREDAGSEVPSGSAAWRCRKHPFPNSTLVISR